MFPNRAPHAVPWADCFTPEPNSGCWIWLLKCNWLGYGRVWHAGKHRFAHRVFYEMLVGPIPPGLVIDHRCRVRCCVNPAHLEPVTERENVVRGAVLRRMPVCKRQHPMEEGNFYYSKDGTRHCRLCAVDRAARRRALLTDAPQLCAQCHLRTARKGQSNCSKCHCAAQRARWPKAKAKRKAIREAARLYITNRGPSPQVTTATVPTPPQDKGPSPTSLQSQE